MRACLESVKKRKAVVGVGLLVIALLLLMVSLAFATAPLPPVLTGATDTTIGGSVKLTWYSTDTDTVTYYRAFYQRVTAPADPNPIQFGGNIPKGATGEATVTGLVNAVKYQFRVEAYNGDGGSGYSNSLDATPTDQTPPVTTLNRYPASSNGANGWYKTVPQYNFSAADSSTVDWTKYSWDTSAPLSVYTTYTAGLLNAPVGSHTVYYLSRDNASPQNIEATKTADWKVDDAKPASVVTTSTSPNGTNGWYKTGDTLPDTTITATDATSGVVKISRAWTDTTPTPSSWTETTFTAAATREVTIAAGALSQGAKYLHHKALDEAGNEETSTYTLYKIDTVTPGAVPTPTATRVTDGHADVSWSSVDDTSSGIAYYNVQRSNPNTITGLSVVATVTGAPSYHDTATVGTNTYYYNIRAVDNAGNAGSYGGLGSVTVDGVVPTQDLTSTPATTTAWVAQTFSITLTAADVGSGLKGQYWRWDGGVLQSSASATVTMTSAEGSHTLTYYALDNVDNTSTVGSQPFKVDLTNPTSANTFTPDSDGPNGSWVSTPTANITAIDPTGTANMPSGVKGIYYRWDTTTTLTYAATSTVATQPSTQGTRTVYWYAEDNAGNRDATQSATAVWDKTVPTINQSLVPTEPASGWYDLASVNVRNEATSSVGTTITSISRKWDDESTWTVSSGAVVTVTATQEGSHTLSAYATDQNGKVSITRNKAVRIDRTDPVFSNQKPTGSAQATRTPAIGATVTDPLSGINWATLGMRVDGVTVTPTYNTLTGDITYTPAFWLNQGEHVVYIEVHDNAGSTSNVASTSFTFNIDTSAPFNTSVLVDGGAATTKSTDVTLTLSASDAYTSVTDMAFSNDGSTWSAWKTYSTESTWALSAGADGNRTVYAKFRDGAGNESSPVNDSITLDTAATAPTGLTAEKGDGQVSLTWNSVSDPSGISGYRVTRGTSPGVHSTLVATVGSPFYVDTSVTNGTTYYYAIVAVDGLGNESVDSNEASAKPQHPSSISIGASSGTITWGGNVTLSGGITPNPDTTVTVTVEKKPFGGTWQTDQTVVTDTNGSYTAVVTPDQFTEYRASWLGDSGAPATSGVVSVQVKSLPRLYRSRSSVYVRRFVRIYGNVSPNHAGTTANVQILSGGVWKNWKAVVLSGTSSFSFYWRPWRRGRYYLRLYMPAAGGNLANYSGTASIRVL